MYEFTRVAIIKYCKNGGTQFWKLDVPNEDGRFDFF
jgi:hypothetical protein